MRRVASSRYMRPGTVNTSGLDGSVITNWGVESRLRFVGSESYLEGDQPLYPPDLEQKIFVQR